MGLAALGALSSINVIISCSIARASNFVMGPERVDTQEPPAQVLHLSQCLKSDDFSNGMFSLSLSMLNCEESLMLLKSILVVVAMLMCSISARASSVVVVERIDGDPLRGLIESGNSKQVVLRTQAAASQVVPFETVTTIRFEAIKPQALPPFATCGWVALASGERLNATPLVVDEDSLTVKLTRLTTLAPIKVSLESCRGLALQVSDDPFRQGIEWKRLVQRDVESDVLALKNGDRVEGEFLGLTDAKFKTKTAIGEVLSDYSAVRSLTLNPSLITVPKRGTRAIWATLMDGSILLLDDFTLKEEFVVVKSVSGFMFELPTAALFELRFCHERLRPLTEIAANSVSTRPLLGTQRQPQVNQNVLSGPLSVAGHPVAFGFGVASGTRMNWSLDGEYQLFATSVGVDDCAGAGGTVEFEILVDDRSKWRSPRLRGRDGLLRSDSISLKGAKRLSLVTHPADHGAVLDFADWSWPVLVK